MNAKRVLLFTAIVTAATAVSLVLTWLAGQDVSQAAPPDIRSTQSGTDPAPALGLAAGPLSAPDQGHSGNPASVSATGAWVIERVDDGDGDDVGLYTSLDLDADGYPHISYFDDSNNALKYAYKDAEGWHTETLTTGLGSRGGYTQLALDAEGYPHITYHDYSDTDFDYAYQDAGGWRFENAVGAGNYDDGYYHSLALGDGGNPRISYFRASSSYDLKYAYRDAGGWRSETVAILGRVGMFSSLALDRDGYPHISYWHYTDYYNSSLEYAFKDAGGWHVVLRVDDTTSQQGRYTSLALDSNGYPHISYHASRYGTLWNTLAYVYWSGTGWVHKNVDYQSGVGVGAYTSLALDGDDYAHISYFDYTNSALKYAYKDGSGWHRRTPDNDGEVGRYTSLELDADDEPHISYYDTSSGDLKYAYYAGPPVASLTGSPTAGPRPLTVRFADTSTGAVDSWLWSFGDGYTSTIQHPTHVYTASGVYTVALAVGGPAGGDAITRTGYIAVRDPIPVHAAFTAAPTTGPHPLTVFYSNTSTGDFDASLWDLGDGMTSTLHSPTHTYAEIGAYTATLAVSGAGGTDTITRTRFVTVTPVPVQAAFTAVPTQGIAPLTVAFTNTSSGDYEDSLWNFGDGTASTGTHPSHQYALPGADTVTLTVSGLGGTDAVTQTDCIVVWRGAYLPLVLRNQ